MRTYLFFFLFLFLLFLLLSLFFLLFLFFQLCTETKTIIHLNHTLWIHFSSSPSQQINIQLTKQQISRELINTQKTSHKHITDLNRLWSLSPCTQVNTRQWSHHFSNWCAIDKVAKMVNENWSDNQCNWSDTLLSILLPHTCMYIDFLWPKNNKNREPVKQNNSQCNWLICDFFLAYADLYS